MIPAFMTFKHVSDTLIFWTNIFLQSVVIFSLNFIFNNMNTDDQIHTDDLTRNLLQPDRTKTKVCRHPTTRHSVAAAMQTPG